MFFSFVVIIRMSNPFYILKQDKIKCKDGSKDRGHHCLPFPEDLEGPPPSPPALGILCVGFLDIPL